MKRKDFLRKMRDRRRRGGFEERRPERRRAVDWRTLRYKLPAEGAKLPEPESTPVGKVQLLPDGVRFDATEHCWVRGYRLWDADDGRRAEFQYRPVDPDSDPPPGSTALAPNASWQPEG